MNTYLVIDTFTLNHIEEYVNINTYPIKNTYVGPNTHPKIRAMTIFGDKLKQFRKAAKLTQEQVAERIGILRTNYVPYETGTGDKAPGDEMLNKIASIKELCVDFSTLKAWRTLDESTEEEREALYKALLEFKADLKDVIEKEDKRRGIS